MGLFVATISLIQYSHLLMVRLAASLASEEFNALSSVLVSFFFWYLNSLMLHFFFLFFFPRLLNFGQREGFVVTVATQSLVATSASSALRKILRI